MVGEKDSITDYFSVGDKVEWVKIRHIGSTVEITKQEGVIKEIIGSKAMIKSPGYARRRMVSLFELKVIK